MFPHASVASHVLVVAYDPAHEPGVVASANVIATVASQASVAVGALNDGTDGQLIGVACSTQVIVGAVTSRTTTVPLQVEVFPQLSVADQTRVMTLSFEQGWLLKESEYAIVGVPEQLSVAVAVPVFAGSVLAGYSMVTLAGQFMVGKL